MFNFEIGDDREYLVTSLPFCSNEYIQSYFPNATIITYERMSNLKEDHLNICLSNDEMYTFLNDWHNKCAGFNKLFDWNIDYWIDSYIKFLQLTDSKLLGDYSVDLSKFNHKKHLQTQKLNIGDMKLVDPVLAFDISVEPELSWCVEDCLFNRKNGTQSRYEAYVNHIIRNNVKRLRQYCDACNLFGRELISFSISLNDGIDINTIDFTNLDAIYYLYAPFPLERVRTNYFHLQNCIEQFNKEGYSYGYFSCCGQTQQEAENGYTEF
jgi:hypothetical protein